MDALAGERRVRGGRPTMVNTMQDRIDTEPSPADIR